MHCEIAGRAERQGRPSGRLLTRNDALRMVKRRAKAAGLPETTSNHTFRATGISEAAGPGAGYRWFQPAPRTARP